MGDEFLRFLTLLGEPRSNYYMLVYIIFQFSSISFSIIVWEFFASSSSTILLRFSFIFTFFWPKYGFLVLATSLLLALESACNGDEISVF